MQNFVNKIIQELDKDITKYTRRKEKALQIGDIASIALWSGRLIQAKETKQYIKRLIKKNESNNHIQTEKKPVTKQTQKKENT